MFIIIEVFDPHYPCIALSEDGSPLLFGTREQAEEVAVEYQDAVIVEY